MEQAVMATKVEPAEREIVLVGPLSLRLGVAMNECGGRDQLGDFL